MEILDLVSKLWISMDFDGFGAICAHFVIDSGVSFPQKRKTHIVTHLCEMGRDCTEMSEFLFFPYESGT